MSAAGALTSGQTLTLVLHSNRHTEKFILPPLLVLSTIASRERLSLLEDGLKGALKTDHVPQLRHGSNKTAAVVPLNTLNACLGTAEGLKSVGFNESGELHLYVDRASSSAQQAAAGKLADPAACFKAGL